VVRLLLLLWLVWSLFRDHLVATDPATQHRMPAASPTRSRITPATEEESRWQMLRWKLEHPDAELIVSYRSFRGIMLLMTWYRSRITRWGRRLVYRARWCQSAIPSKKRSL
jgi:hypothetical protein